MIEGVASQGIVPIPADRSATDEPPNEETERNRSWSTWRWTIQLCGLTGSCDSRASWRSRQREPPPCARPDHHLPSAPGQTGTGGPGFWRFSVSSRTNADAGKAAPSPRQHKPFCPLAGSRLRRHGQRGKRTDFLARDLHAHRLLAAPSATRRLTPFGPPWQAPRPGVGRSQLSRRAHRKRSRPVSRDL